MTGPADPGVKGPRPVSADRQAGPRWLTPVLAALLAAQLWSALTSIAVAGDNGTRAAEFAAVPCAILAVFGLRSVPLRRIVWPFTVLSGAVLARFGLLASAAGLSGSWRAFLWLGTTAVALWLVPSVADLRGVDEEGGVVVVRAGTALFTSMVLILTAVLGAALVIGPRVASAVPTGTTAGDAVSRKDNFPSNPLDANDHLDMTRRPRLSDRVVMTVRSPVASFWRTEVYDTWSGSVWTRSYGNEGLLVGDGTIVPSADDLAARSGVPFEQEFRLEVGFTTALPAAPSPVELATDRAVGQRPDGTMVTVDRPVGRGGTYTVTSRQVPTTYSALGTLGTMEVPTDVLAQYAQGPVATPRTVALTRELTERLDSNLDKVEAISDWMATNTSYSLDAPLSPPGVDVVDHFLFESQLGWCEQIASSLVVMARIAGVPARVATGFVPGDWDDVSRRFVVRERDAHAWAEVWFPEVGWVPFDPTASVPLAGSPESDAGLAASGVPDTVGVALLLLAAAVALGRPVSRLALRATARVSRWRARRRLIATNWDVREEESIESQGRQMGRSRDPAETLTGYTADLVSLGASSELADRARMVEEHRYAAGRSAHSAP